MDKRPRRIGILPLPGFALMSYACTVEPFRAANLLSGRTLYEILHFTTGGRTRSSGAASIGVQYGVGDTPRLDLLLVVAGGDPLAFDDPRTLAWLRRMDRQTPLVGGVSGGPVVLARAGLMAARRMTVHWEHAPALAERDPNLLLERQLFVIDRNRVTSGGGTAALDLMHALIAGDHGESFARRVSEWFLHTDIRPPGGAQRRFGAVPGAVGEALAAMEARVADPLSLSDLAARARLSARQLSRAFQSAFGVAPMVYYRNLRLDVARRLMRQTGLSLTEIALATGFANSAHFSRAYRGRFGTAPSGDRLPLAGRGS